MGREKKEVHRLVGLYSQVKAGLTRDRQREEKSSVGKMEHVKNLDKRRMEKVVHLFFLIS